MLHVLDGDATLPAFQSARLPGESVVWREALIDGPWPRQLRGVDEALNEVAEAVKQDQEVVLWFDDDLFCRLHAAYFATHFAGARMTNALGSHADPGDLPALFDRRVPLDPALADAWSAYASPDPRALVPLAARFPWLRLHLERFPSARDGLNAIERRILELLRDAPRSFSEIFRGVSAALPPARWGLGDLQVERELRELGPLVAGELGRWGVTRAGFDVLDGRANRLAIAPLDRWLGGCHLAPGKPAWRWTGGALVRKP